MKDKGGYCDEDDEVCAIGSDGWHDDPDRRLLCGGRGEVGRPTDIVEVEGRPQAARAPGAGAHGEARGPWAKLGP